MMVWYAGGVPYPRPFHIFICEKDDFVENIYHSIEVEPKDFGLKFSDVVRPFLQKIGVKEDDAVFTSVSVGFNVTKTITELDAMNVTNVTFHHKMGSYALVLELRKPQPDEAVVKDMINKGVKIDAHTKQDGTPLHAAARTPKLMRLLLDETVKMRARVNLNVPYSKRSGKTVIKDTPLREALLHPDGEEVAIMLLDAGASMTAAVGRDGDTVLHAAAYSGWKKLAKRALDAGLDPMKKWDGTNSFQWAAIGRQDRIYGTKGIQDNHGEIIAMMKQPKGGAPAAKKEAGQRRQRAEEEDSSSSSSRRSSSSPSSSSSSSSGSGSESGSDSE